MSAVRSGTGFYPRLRRAWFLTLAKQSGSARPGDIVAAFDVSRAQASADVAEVLHSRPVALVYDLSAKSYLWTGKDLGRIDIPAPVAFFALEARFF